MSRQRVSSSSPRPRGIWNGSAICSEKASHPRRGTLAGGSLSTSRRRSDSRRAIRLLAAEGAGLDAPDEIGWSPLTWAAWQGSLEGTRALIAPRRGPRRPLPAQPCDPPCVSSWALGTWQRTGLPRRRRLCWRSGPRSRASCSKRRGRSEHRRRVGTASRHRSVSRRRDPRRALLRPRGADRRSVEREVLHPATRTDRRSRARRRGARGPFGIRSAGSRKEESVKQQVVLNLIVTALLSRRGGLLAGVPRRSPVLVMRTLLHHRELPLALRWAPLLRLIP